MYIYMVFSIEMAKIARELYYGRHFSYVSYIYVPGINSGFDLCVVLYFFCLTCFVFVFCPLLVLF